MVFKKFFLILWLLFFSFSLNLFTAVEEDDYSSMAASNLVKRLMSQNPGIRSMAFYELRRRYPLCPETRSYAEFAKDIKIWEVIECPPGKNKPPVYLVLFDLQYESSYPGQDYRTPAREIFEKKRDKTGLKWENNINITAFDSAGGDLKIPGCHEIHHGVIADINGDGLIEVVDTFLENKLDDKPQGMVLKVWTIKENPQCKFALLYNLGEEDWGYALEDKDNDGIYDILLGPGKPGDVTPVVTYKWDKGKGTYNGPPGGENDCFRITDAAAVEEEPGEVVIGSFPKDPWESGPKFQNYNKPYSYFSLKNLSNREILEYIKDGKTVQSLEWEAVKPKFPGEFRQKKPKEAILDLIEMNRNPGHKRQFQIAVDDRGGLELPGQCRIFYSYVDNPFYPSYLAQYFIQCSPGDSYLAYAVCSTAGPFHRRLSDQEAVFKFRLCPIPYEIARHFVDSAWWLNQVRSRELNDDMGFYSVSG
ncbi:MAG TPA: hypothetical protein VK186_10320, partial [Candidatus Deferrimicrobium sp.]|nr:hypothetical protein [Candidatus Deferrimicrobium sp.]